MPWIEHAAPEIRGAEKRNRGCGEEKQGVQRREKGGAEKRKRGCGEEKRGCREEKKGVPRREIVLWGHCTNCPLIG